MRQPGRETLTSRAGGSLVVTAPEEARGPLAQAEIHRARVRRRLADISWTDMCWDLCPGAGWSHFEFLRCRFRTGAASPATASPGPGVLRPPLLADFLEVE